MTPSAYRAVLVALVLAMLAVADQENSLAKQNDYRCVLDCLLRMMAVTIPPDMHDAHDIMHTTLRGMPYHYLETSGWPTIQNMCLDLYNVLNGQAK